MEPDLAKSPVPLLELTCERKRNEPKVKRLKVYWRKIARAH